MTFGTTYVEDLRELQEAFGPKWAEPLAGIRDGLLGLEAALLAIKKSMAELEAAGMWPGVPLEVWEDRDNTSHGEKRYLRLKFKKGAWPDGRRGLYIGCKPDKITAARQKAARRRRWEALEAERERLDRFLRMTRSSIGGVAGQVQRYRIPDDLGLELDVAEASAGPKPLPPESSPEWIRTRPVVRYDVEGEGG